MAYAQVNVYIFLYHVCAECKHNLAYLTTYANGSARVSCIACKTKVPLTKLEKKSL